MIMVDVVCGVLCHNNDSCGLLVFFSSTTTMVDAVFWVLLYKNGSWGLLGSVSS